MLQNTLHSSHLTSSREVEALSERAAKLLKLIRALRFHVGNVNSNIFEFNKQPGSSRSVFTNTLTLHYWQHNTSIRHLQTSSFPLRRHSSSCFSSPSLSRFWEHQQMLSLDPFLCCKITYIPWTPAIGVLTRGLVLLRAAGLRSSSGTKEKEGSLNPEVRITDMCWSRIFRDSIRARTSLRVRTRVLAQVCLDYK